MEETQKSNKKLLYGVGFNGFGNNNDKSYTTWTNMFKRCYSEKLRNQPTYIDCKVDERWFDFNVYLEWFNDNYKDGYQLDKDILIKGNKIYGPDTCCFVPEEINKAFTKSNKIRGKLPIGVCVFRNKYQTQMSKFGNKLFFGNYDSIEEAFNVYKQEKEKYIHELAEKWKNQINEKIYLCLINYTVDIND